MLSSVWRLTYPAQRGVRTRDAEAFSFTSPNTPLVAKALTVHLNRHGPDSIEPAVHTFSTEGPFQIRLENHGRQSHIHLHLDDDLAAIASLEEVNPYVPTGQTTVWVDVDEATSGEGELEIATGYGAASESVTIVCRRATSEQSTEVALHSEQPTPDVRQDIRTLPFVAFALGAFVAVGLMLVSEIAGLLFGALALGVGLGLLLFHPHNGLLR